MKRYSAQYIRHHFGTLLDEVAAGETVQVTRDGKPVAYLSAESPTQIALNNWLAFQRSCHD